MRSFHFSDDATKAAAKAAASDAVNPGLQYAKTYTGRNGCDVEIVLEFQPKADVSASARDSSAGMAGSRPNMRTSAARATS